MKTGQTIQFAEYIAREAGAKDILRTDNLNVYCDASEKCFERGRTTSVHAPRMRKIGQKATRTF